MRYVYVVYALPIIGFRFDVYEATTKREAEKERRRLQRIANKHKDGSGHHYAIRKRLKR